MSNLITPPEIDDVIISFCKKISKSKPYYVRVEPEPYSEPSFCFPNVQKKIKKSGGECLHGWQLWLHPAVFIEAEFHGIWKSSQNKRIDITPKLNGEKKILFLPDSEKIYTESQVNNIRYPLSHNGLIPQFFATFDAMFAMNNFGERKNESEVKFIGEEVEIFKWLTLWQMVLEIMIKEGKSQNSLCPCGNATPYKRCCCKNFDSKMKDIRSRYEF